MTLPAVLCEANMTTWPENLPLRYDIEGTYGSDEEDVVFDNGEVFFFGSVYKGELHIHEFFALDKALQKARTGAGRRALEEVRPYFLSISPRQVATDLRENPGMTVLEHPAFLFWRAMLGEGLVDRISLGYDEHQVTRENISDRISGTLGDFVPGERFELIGPGACL